MTVNLSDFATYKEVLEYTNTHLDEWMENVRELEEDLELFGSNPPFEDVEKISTKWRERTVEIQEVRT